MLAIVLSAAGTALSAWTKIVWTKDQVDAKDAENAVLKARIEWLQDVSDPRWIPWSQAKIDALQEQLSIKDAEIERLGTRALPNAADARRQLQDERAVLSARLDLEREPMSYRILPILVGVFRRANYSVSDFVRVVSGLVESGLLEDALADLGPTSDSDGPG